MFGTPDKSAKRVISCPHNFKRLCDIHVNYGLVYHRRNCVTLRIIGANIFVTDLMEKIAQKAQRIRRTKIYDEERANGERKR